MSKTYFHYIFLSIVLPVLLSCSGEQAQGPELQSEADLSGLRIATEAGTIYDIELSQRDDISLWGIELGDKILLPESTL